MGNERSRTTTARGPAARMPGHGLRRLPDPTGAVDHPGRPGIGAGGAPSRAVARGGSEPYGRRRACAGPGGRLPAAQGVALDDGGAGAELLLAEGYRGARGVADPRATGPPPRRAGRTVRLR